MLFLTLETANKEEKLSMFVQTITFHHNSHSSSSRADLTQTSPTVSNETNNTTKKPTQQYKIAVRRAKDACRMWSAKLSVRWTAVCIHFKHYIYYILVYSVGESDKCSPKVRASEATILRYCRQQRESNLSRLSTCHTVRAAVLHLF